MKSFNQQGMISFSVSIILCLVAICLLYIYKLALWQNDSIMILQRNLQAENYTISETENLIEHFKEDKNFWKENIDKAKDSFSFDKAIMIDERVVTKQQNKIQIKAYLMKVQEDNMYKLIVETAIKDITNQVCIYLMVKDDECIVQRWER